ncbi:MAG: Cache 3/Cache 2 fusion domain-containing protein [Caldilineaceae bacterium]
MLKTDGSRAIGTYIPVDPGGQPNAVVSTLLNGETYRIAYVVNAWYITAYEPILNERGIVVGALYVGVKQENISALREAIMNTTVGSTGYVYILGGQGNDRDTTSCHTTVSAATAKTSGKARTPMVASSSKHRQPGRCTWRRRIRHHHLPLAERR